MSIELQVRCKKCGIDLTIDMRGSELLVAPCDNCIEETGLSKHPSVKVRGNCVYIDVKE